MKSSPRTAILLGHGVRAAGAADIAPRLLEFGVPVMTSWQAKDLVDNDHVNYYGCPGIYGNRSANAALYAADRILAIGNRLSIWNVGYDGPRKDQHVVMVDVDRHEVEKHADAVWINEDARAFIQRELLFGERPARWSIRKHPTLESPAHDDANGFINSYRFFDALQRHLRPDEVVTIDCGSACASAFQAFHVKPPQRLISSGGLGEMGCALPYAVGASFARGKRDVIAIVGDGAMMLNLQELQTIVHHRLPVKIIVCRNDGYLMIRKTQANAGMQYAGVSASTGVSSPRFQQLAFAFGIHAASVKTWADFETAVPAFLAHDGPALIEYHMDPEQVIAPKLGYDAQAANPRYARFDQMHPPLKEAA